MLVFQTPSILGYKTYAASTLAPLSHESAVSYGTIASTKQAADLSSEVPLPTTPAEPGAEPLPGVENLVMNGAGIIAPAGWAGWHPASARRSVDAN